MKLFKRIRKYFKTLSQAESHQLRLYGKYDSVQLESFPRFTEEGVYVWSVR
jgi:hypothetical protein